MGHHLPHYIGWLNQEAATFSQARCIAKTQARIVVLQAAPKTGLEWLPEQVLPYTSSDGLSGCMLPPPPQSLHHLSALLATGIPMNCKSFIKIFSAPSVRSPLTPKDLGSDVQVTASSPGFPRERMFCFWLGRHLGHHCHQIVWVGSDLKR